MSVDVKTARNQISEFVDTIDSLRSNENFTTQELIFLNTFNNTLNKWVKLECGQESEKENICLSQLTKQLKVVASGTKKVKHAAFEFGYSDFHTKDTNNLFPKSPIEVSPSIVANMGFYRNFHQTTDFSFCAGLRSTSQFTISIDTPFDVILTLCVFGDKNRNTFTHEYLMDPRVPQMTEWPTINEHMFKTGGFVSNLDEKVRVVVTYVYEVTVKEVEEVKINESETVVESENESTEN